jgi:4-carboxymuconolactone decarboxylase
MTRIHNLDPATMTAEQKRVYDAIANSPRGGVRGPLAVWLHRPEMADKAQALGTYCRYGTSLEKRLSELAIIILGRIWNAEFEWQAHKPMALQNGISEAVVEAIRTHATPAFEKEDEAVTYDFVTTLHREHGIPDDLYARAVSIIGEGGVVDLVAIAGYYTLVSMTIQAFRVTPLHPDKLELQEKE